MRGTENTQICKYICHIHVCASPGVFVVCVGYKFSGMFELLLCFWFRFFCSLSCLEGRQGAKQTTSFDYSHDTLWCGGNKRAC